MVVAQQETLFDGLLIIGRWLGMSRSVATVFAVLYDQTKPYTVDELASASGLSKSAVSLALRDLLQFGAVQELSPVGERCRRYSGQPDLAQTVKQLILSRVVDILDEFRTCIESTPKSHRRTEQARDLLATFEQVVAAINTKH